VGSAARLAGEAEPASTGAREKVEAMLKITPYEAAGALRLALEGRLVGAWVCELEHCWRAAKARDPGRPLIVDLTGVTFIDRAGRYLLQLMHRHGVDLVASGLLQEDLLEHLTDAGD
jgi:anti-anti-sigma regulatory factor